MNSKRNLKRLIEKLEELERIEVQHVGGVQMCDVRGDQIPGIHRVRVSAMRRYDGFRCQYDGVASESVVKLENHTKH